ncbi:MAG: hypothetical protein WC942_01840 [Clostridia bacterium]|jgi:hypothetical protein
MNDIDDTQRINFIDHLGVYVDAMAELRGAVAIAAEHNFISLTMPDALCLKAISLDNDINIVSSIDQKQELSYYGKIGALQQIWQMIDRVEFYASVVDDPSENAVLIDTELGLITTTFDKTKIDSMLYIMPYKKGKAYLNDVTEIIKKYSIINIGLNIGRDIQKLSDYLLFLRGIKLACGCYTRLIVGHYIKPNITKIIRNCDIDTIGLPWSLGARIGYEYERLVLNSRNK